MPVLTATPEQVKMMVDVLQETIYTCVRKYEKLEAEAQRLREALHHIQRTTNDPLSYQLAREALEGERP